MKNIKLLVLMSNWMDVHFQFQICSVNPYNNVYGNLDNVQLHHEIRNNPEVGYEGATPPDYPPSLSIKVHVITVNYLSFIPDWLTASNINC